MKLPKIKISRVNKLRAGQMLAVLTYAIGVGLYSGLGKIEAYEEGFKNGTKAMADAYDLNEEDK